MVDLPFLVGCQLNNVSTCTCTVAVTNTFVTKYFFSNIKPGFHWTLGKHKHKQKQKRKKSCYDFYRPREMVFALAQSYSYACANIDVYVAQFAALFVSPYACIYWVFKKRLPFEVKRPCRMFEFECFNH